MKPRMKADVTYVLHTIIKVNFFKSKVKLYDMVEILCLTELYVDILSLNVYSFRLLETKYTLEYMRETNEIETRCNIVEI